MDRVILRVRKTLMGYYEAQCIVKIVKFEILCRRNYLDWHQRVAYVVR